MKIDYHPLIELLINSLIDSSPLLTLSLRTHPILGSNPMIAWTNTYYNNERNFYFNLIVKRS